jgi:hypothetical protein
MNLNFASIKNVIAAALIMCLTACASNTKISRSIKDSDYKNKIDDVLVIFDLKHFEKALAIQNPVGAENHASTLAIEFRSKMSVKLSAKNIKSEIIILNNRTSGPFVSDGINNRISNSSNSILLIEFSSFRTINGQWDGHMDFRAKLFSGKNTVRDLSKEKAIWVAEADRFKLSSGTYETITNNIVSAIIDGLQADGFIK